MATIIAGRNSVAEALKAGRSLTKIYMTADKASQPLRQIKALAREKGVPL